MSAVKTSALATFATQVKAWRKSRGWSQGDLAAKLAYSDSLVSGIETMAKTPTLEFAKGCDEAFGLLQTENYARSVISAGKPRLGQADLDRKVNARIDRQRLFEGDNPPLYWTVLHEGALRQVIGSPSITSEQLDKIIQAAQSPDIVVQVLPFTASDHSGTDGPITVFDFTDAPSIAYSECNGGGMVTEGPESVAELMTTMNMLRAAALPKRESTDLLRRIRSEIE
jgi:transcriptional regulator with XRE-family HTH domain